MSCNKETSPVKTKGVDLSQQVAEPLKAEATVSCHDCLPLPGKECDLVRQFHFFLQYLLVSGLSHLNIFKFLFFKFLLPSGTCWGSETEPAKVPQGSSEAWALFRPVLAVSTFFKVKSSLFSGV